MLMAFPALYLYPLDATPAQNQEPSEPSQPTSLTSSTPSATPQSPVIASRVDKMRVLECVTADAIKREVCLLRQLVDKSHATQDHEQGKEREDFGDPGAGSDDDDA